MKRANEVLVGVVVLVAVAIVVGGSLWISQWRAGGSVLLQEARFRTIGGLQVGDPVLLRGVRIGRVEVISLGDSNWVNVTLQIARGVPRLPERPLALIFSATLFGDWSVQILSRDPPPDDPEVNRQVLEAERAGLDRWPGATLPDVGQLTAQAGRIAGDIAVISGRVQDAFDATSARRLRSAFLDFSQLSRSLATIAAQQQATLGRIGGNLDTGTASLARSAAAIERAANRADSASDRTQLQSILSNTDTVARELRRAATDLRGITGAASAQQEAIARIIARSDSIFARVQAGEGTLGRLTRDTTLYHESIEAVRSLRDLLLDIRQNPRRYFQFSVF